MNLLCVPPDRVAQFWPLAERFVRSAVARDRAGLADLDDIQTDVYSGFALLWLAADDRRIWGAGVTRLDRDFCEIIAWGADDQERCTPLLAEIERYAKAEGKTKIRTLGRKGWERVLDGYKQVSVILEKAL